MMNFKILYRPFVEPLKGNARGFTALWRNKYYIVIDSDLGPLEREKTLKHELSHIYLNHFEQIDRDQDEMEDEAIAHAAAMTETEFQDLMKYAV